MKRWIILGTLTLGIFMAVIGCTSLLQSPNEESIASINAGAVTALSTEANGSLDELFLQVSALVPEFGGLYLDADGNPVFYLTDPNPNVLAAALNAVYSVFGADERLQSSALALQAQYGFGQLKTWHDAITAEVLAITGVVFTDIDERNNRLLIGVQSLDLLDEVEAALNQIGAPRDAVNIVQTAPITYAADTLQSRVRPLVGGLQINFFAAPVSPVTYVCTLGFVAVRERVEGYVTNSHCTANQGGNDETEHFQPDGADMALLDTTNRVGLETVDPEYFMGQGVCPTGFRCRYSDSSFIKAPHPSGPETTLNQGYLSRASVISTAESIDLSIDEAKPTWKIVGEMPVPLAGEILNKTGRTTGWSQGAVVNTCINSTVLGTALIAQLCQDVVAANVDGGDSGSPVFRITNMKKGEVKLYGILWGSSVSVDGATTTFVFSAIGPYNVQRASELGTLSNCASASC